MAREEKPKQMPLPVTKEAVMPEVKPEAPPVDAPPLDVVKPVAESPKLIMVVATAKGFYKQSRKKPGDKFQILDSHFAKHWMKKI